MSTFYKPIIRPDELYHYGVLGMRWGVRRAKKSYASGNTEMAKRRYEKPFAKAEAKAQRYDAKIAKKQIKADKFRQKADRKKYGLFSNANKARKLDYKASKKQYKVNKQVEKALKWHKQMAKQFSNTPYTKITEDQRKRGKRYQQLLRNRTLSAM